MKKTTKALSLVLLFVLALSLFAAAAGGNGSGGGEGGGQELPTLQSSSVENGATDVPVNLANIVLQFTNNVVNMTVKDNNVGCFSLKDSTGKAAAISVEMGDDQVDPSIKEVVTLKLGETLKADETYTLTVRGALKAKNGNTMGKDATVSFTTAKATPVTSTESKLVAEPVAISENPTSGSEAETLPAAGGYDGILFAALGFAVLLIVCGVVLKKRQSN
jgi:LPXTG-motif cell wall-anchored protein